MTLPHRLMLLATVGTVATAISAPVFAQAPAEANSDQQLEEIIVTAQRREENLQKVPVAVTALSETRLANAVIKSAADLNVTVPALNIVAALGYVKPYIRGIGSNAQAIGLEAPVSVYVDGVYLLSTPSAAFTFGDVKRVEVLKGPQGTLFGRNATGGLIQIITKDPGNTFTLSAEAGFDNYETLSLNGYIAGPVSSTLSASLAAQYTDQGKGYGRNLFNGDDVNLIRHEFAVRGKVMWEPGPDTQVRLSGDYTDRDAPLFAWRAPEGYKPRLAATVGQGSSRPWDVNSNFANVADFRGGGGSVKIDHDFGGISVMSLTAYRKIRFRYAGDVDVTPVPALALDVTTFERQFTQELQFKSDGDSAFNWVAGLFFMDAKGRLDPSLVLPSATVPTAIAKRITLTQIGTKSYSGFAQGDLKITDTTKITAGIRYTREPRTVAFETATETLAGTRVSTGRGAQERTFSKLTWRLSLDQQFSPTFLGYVSYNRGFKSGGFTASFPSDAPYAPEVIDAYEVGVKADLFDRRVRFNPSLFYYDYANLQVAYTRNGLLGVQNGAKARIYGFDADFDAVIGPNFSLNGGLQLINAKFTSYPAGILATYQPLTGGFVQSTGNLTGREVPNVAKVTGTLGFDIHTAGSGPEWGLSMNYQYSSGYFTEADNVLEQPAFHKINAAIRWLSSDRKYKVTLWGKNLLNEAVFNQAAAGTFSGQASYQPPRTYGFTAGVNF